MIHFTYLTEKPNKMYVNTIYHKMTPTKCNNMKPASRKRIRHL